MLEQLLFLVLFLLVLLVSSVLVEVLKRQQRIAQPEGEPEAPVLFSKAPLRPSPPLASPPTPRAGPCSTPVSETPPPSVTRRRARVGSLRDVRRGIVLMTILGPCRALESPRPPQ
jgi:hypothetical protein